MRLNGNRYNNKSLYGLDQILRINFKDIELSIGRVVIFVENQPFDYQISLLLFPHLRQNNEAFLFGLDKPIERVVVEASELNPFTHTADIDQERRVADLTFKDNFDQFQEKGGNQLDCFFPIGGAQAELVHQLLYSSGYLVFFCYQTQNFFVLRLKSFPQHIQHWSFQGLQTTDRFQSSISALKVIINHTISTGKQLHVEVDHSLQSQLLWPENVEISVQAVALVELCDFGCKLVRHGERRRGIGEASDHMSKVVLQFEYFFLQIVIIFLELIALFLAIGQFTNQNLDFVLEFPKFSCIALAHLIELLLILVLFVEITLMRFVFVGFVFAVVVALVHDSKQQRTDLSLQFEMALLKEDNNFTHVIAIDFGTGASGFAIAPRLPDQEGKLRIEVFNPCDGSDDQKTPTAILFDENKEFLQFGVNAIQKYAQIVEDGGSAYLFQNYKMHLLHMHTAAKAVDGRQMPLLTIVEHTLRFISQQALSKLREQVGKVAAAKIRWVLTVPALWSEEHKLFMRKAALQAEITDSVNSSNLLLCLQPEGASIQCREDAEPAVRSQLGKEKVVMVLDCGGGTVDITVHKLLCEVEEKFLCNELIPSSGGCEWGSKYVDIYFQEFLCELLGEKLAGVYKENALARLDILRDFQTLKRKFKGQKDERSIVKLSYLGEHLNSKILKTLVQTHNAKHKDFPELHVKVKGASNIEIPSPLMSSFFQPLFENIKSKVQQLISQIEAKKQQLNFIFMVGGFSESPYLKNQIIQRFQNQKIQILVPRRPQISVVRGACLYGLNPRSITSRIAKKTYGINTLTVFDEEIHPLSKKVVIEGEEFCEDVFDAFVRKGDSVSIDEVHTKIYCPVRTRQTIMRIIFYETDLSDVQFIDEEHVRPLGELAIDIGKTGQLSEEKTVKVTLLFGHTHIYATATNKEGTEVKHCEFRFECHS